MYYLRVTEHGFVQNVYSELAIIQDEDTSGLVPVEELLTPENMPGKNAEHHYDFSTGKQYYKYTDRPLTTDEELVALKAQVEPIQFILDDAILRGVL